MASFQTGQEAEGRSCPTGTPVSGPVFRLKALFIFPVLDPSLKKSCLETCPHLGLKTCLEACFLKTGANFETYIQFPQKIGSPYKLPPSTLLKLISIMSVPTNAKIKVRNFVAPAVVKR